MAELEALHLGADADADAEKPTGTRPHPSARPGPQKVFSAFKTEPELEACMIKS